MSTQRKLTALLHELQHASSPLAQARVLARSWRTLGELSPTDRQLLARHAGFEGAEEILEGLGRGKGGLAPAMLLRVLANARNTDESAVKELLAAIRGPERRGEAISIGAELASDLLGEPEVEQDREEVVDALEELRAIEDTIVEKAEEAISDLDELELEDEGQSREIAAESEPDFEEASETETETVAETEAEPEPESEQIPEPEPELQPPPSPPPPPEQVVEWSRWQSTRESSRPAPQPRPEATPSLAGAGSGKFDVRAVAQEICGVQSFLSRLLVLRRELSAFEGLNPAALKELVEIFPDGWARRRALCAILEAGILTTVDDALELVSSLGRELDRRWCLGILARRGELGGRRLDRALEMVTSPSSRRRLRIAAQT